MSSIELFFCYVWQESRTGHHHRTHTAVTHTFITGSKVTSRNWCECLREQTEGTCKIHVRKAWNRTQRLLVVRVVHHRAATAANVCTVSKQFSMCANRKLGQMYLTQLYICWFFVGHLLVYWLSVLSSSLTLSLEQIRPIKALWLFIYPLSPFLISVHLVFDKNAAN